MKSAEQVVNMLLETGIFRVCAACEQEVGPQPEQPGTRKSHGLCRRHTIASYNEAGLSHLIPKIEQMPDDGFPPDLSAGQPRQEAQEERACHDCARELGTIHDRSYGQCKRHWLAWAAKQGFSEPQQAEVIRAIEAGQGWAPDLGDPTQ